METSSGNQLSQIGIGSFGVGGRGHRDVALTEIQADEAYVNALKHSLDSGSNFTEISLGYGHGHTLRLFKQALDGSNLAREDVFITHSLYGRDLESFETIHEDTATFYRVMESDYADSTLVTQSIILSFGEKEVYQWLHSLLKTGRTRYVSLSNASPTWVQKFKEEFGDAFFAHEGHLSFEVRALQDKGVLALCDKLAVANIIWRPLRRNATLSANWPMLRDLANKYQKTQSQIVLNWMCSLGYMPMVFSTNVQHINENLTATDFTMDDADIRQITTFRLTTKRLPGIDWEGEQGGNDIVDLIKTIDDHIV